MVNLLSSASCSLARGMLVMVGLALWGTPAFARTPLAELDDSTLAVASNGTIPYLGGLGTGKPWTGPRTRFAESRDKTIDYRGTYWGDSLPAAAPPPAAKPRNPLANFLPDPDASHRYDEWSRQTYFDRSKRTAPTGDEPGIKEKPAITFLKLKF